MTENLISKIERLGAEAGLVMTPESRRFALLVRADVVAEWPKRTWVQLTDEELSILGEKFTHPDEGIDEVDFGMEVQRILKEKNHE